MQNKETDKEVYMMATYIVTIDGPSSSGKTSVSRELAKRFSWKWVSTGAFYRTIAYMVKVENIDINSENYQEQVCNLIEKNEWQVEMSDEKTKGFYKNKEITNFIYQEDISNLASFISSYPKVRKILLEAQRNCAKNVSGLIAEGRDAGSVVFENADFKFYITAHEKNRASRRAKELNISEEIVEKNQQNRDKQDSTRVNAPLTIPKEADIIDTSNLDLIGVVDLIEKRIKEKAKVK